MICIYISEPYRHTKELLFYKLHFLWFSSSVQHRTVSLTCLKVLQPLVIRDEVFFQFLHMGLLQRCSWAFLFSSFLLGHDICQHQVSSFSFSRLCLAAALRVLWPSFAVCLGMRGYQCIILLMAVDRCMFWAYLVNLGSEAES